MCFTIETGRYSCSTAKCLEFDINDSIVFNTAWTISLLTAGRIAEHSDAVGFFHQPTLPADVHNGPSLFLCIRAVLCNG
jgi:hypothetical protein